MSMNFYRFLFGWKEPVAEDAMVMRKHPDGSPCYAKKEEDCPILNREKKADKADDLKSERTSDGSVEKRHLLELHDRTMEQIRNKVPGFENLSFSELEEAYIDFEDRVTKVTNGGVTPFADSRKRRDDVWGKHKDATYQSFSLESGDIVTNSDGMWGVTFHTTSAEESMSNAEYDTNVAIYAKVFNAKPQVGVYEGACEMSYCCDSLLRSAAALVYCEQKSIFGFMQAKEAKPDEYGIDIDNYSYDQKINNLPYPN